MSDLLTELEQTYPGLEAFLDTLKRFFQVEEGLRPLFIQALQAMDREALERAYRQLEAEGVVPSLEVRTDRQVAALWTNPLFETVLHSVGFFPPPEVDLRKQLPPPCQDWSSLEERGQQLATMFPEEPYWKCILHRSFSELYLEPYLAKMQPPLRGCDLACGWGRATFSLRQFHNREVYGCDVSLSSLELLQELARATGLEEQVRPVVCDLSELPFEDDFFDFFLAFDIIEQLTDPAIDKLLSETLRCAKPGAILYAEIAVHSVYPGLTHIQNFSPPGIIARLQSHQAHGKRFRMCCHKGILPDQFTFKVVKPGPARRFRGKK